MFQYKVILAISVLAIGILISASGAMARGTDGAIRRINACNDQFADKGLRACVAGAFDQFAGALTSSNSVSSASPVARSTAAGLRGAASRAAAVSVLQRAQSMISNLASGSSGNARENYHIVNRAFSRALAVINTKG